MTDTFEIPTMADTCMLARLKRKKPSTTKQVTHDVRDAIRDQLGDESLTLNKHLFKEGPVRDLLRMMDRVYEDHKAMTAAYIDRGPRVLPGDQFDAYAEIMENHKEKLEAAAKQVFAQWDQLVQQDIDHRKRKCKTADQASLVHVGEYPTQEQAEDMFYFTWTVKPIPKGEDFRTQVPQYMKDRLADELNEARDAVRHDLIARMLEDVKKAAEKLAVPIGEKGSVFRDSLVNNLQQTLHTARTFNVNGDPNLEKAISELNIAVNGYVGSAESMRSMEGKRLQAAKKLDELVGTFSSLM